MMLPRVELPRRVAVRTAWALPLLPVPALTLYLAFHAGGFFPGATSLAATEMAFVVLACLVVARRPFEGASVPFFVALVALGGLAGWTLLSANWSGSMARALPEYTRTLLYFLTFAFFGLLPFDARRIRWMIYAFAGSIVAICAFALIARTLPHVIFDPALSEVNRLGYPLTYWNALGLLAGVGVVLCGHLSCSAKEPWPARVLGAAVVPLVTLTLYYTLSRGASWATVVAVVAYVSIGRPRALLSGAVATLPATLIVLIVANPPSSLLAGGLLGADAVAAGHRVVIVLLACMLGAGLTRATLLRFDRWALEFHLARRARMRVLAAALVVAVLVLAGAVAAGAPNTVSAKYGQLTSKNDPEPGAGGSSRLFSASTNGRKEHWKVALAAFRRNELHGSGAGTYALLWARERPNSVTVLDAHSLYLQTLGELGLVGFVLLVIVLVAILAAFVYRARGPDRVMFAALLAAALAWVAAVGVDWDWQMPATSAWLFAFGGAALARSARTRRVSRARRSAAATIALRVTGVVACIALAVTPARVALAAERFEGALRDFRDGDCAQAVAGARSALSAEGQKASPYVLIAFCDMQEGRYRAALGAARSAYERDPHSWETNYDLAASRAAVGLDPREAARRAALLNPRDPLASAAPHIFGSGSRRAWIAAGRGAALVPPSADQP